ncbi:LysM peptidoglycan-binding domain-containing protein [Microbacterium oxydans]|uniref:LysM peptidoglycan-binding domain-containing protein n=1 Tax=Microbacterium oxydans TaxID=82380 RepID=UPI00226B25C3|nr:LysM domain-containing protein [Microbacterium oxydans]WAA66335.1 LysM peptidoglycan-binding domain-containing protein [Microbacterium oxydans]
MKRSTKITTAVVVVAVAGLVAAAAPAVVSAAPAVFGVASWASERFAAAEPSTTPTSRAADAEDPARENLVSLGDGISVPAGGPGDCTTNAFINIGSDDGETMHAKLLGELVEMGESELARGPVTLDADGEIFSYEVQAGDSLIAIGERFCVDYVTVGSFNHVRGFEPIAPGDVLYLRPDPTLPFVDIYSPYKAEPGSSTIAYSDGVAAFSTAVATADLGAARWLWKRLEKDMSPATAAVITRALRDEDLSLLGRMFP